MMSAELEGAKTGSTDDAPDLAAYVRAGGDYFRVLQVPLLAGRYVTPAERREAWTDEASESGTSPIIINRAFAEQLAPSLDLVGQRLRLNSSPDAPWHTVVGIVGDVKAFGLTAQIGRQQIYVPLRPDGDLVLAMRLAGDPLAHAQALRRVIAAMDPDLPISELSLAVDRMAGTIDQPRFTARLMGAFAAVALSMAALGLYGILSFSVAQRTREIGIRRALGASRGATLRLVIGDGIGMVLVGLGAGILGAQALVGVVATMLYGVESTQPSAYAVVVVVVFLTGVVASIVPALRATRVSAMVAMQAE